MVLFHILAERLGSGARSEAERPLEPIVRRLLYLKNDEIPFWILFLYRS